MTTVDNGRFKLIYRSRKHHYLWQEQLRGEFGPGSLVISDHSADDMSDYPTSVEYTDDGVLYIDVDRIIERGGLTVYRHEHNAGTELWVPLFKVVNSSKVTSSCITGLPTALKLLSQPSLKARSKVTG